MRVLAHMLELWRRTDEDLTDLTDPELVELCAKYALHQEGADFRVRGAVPADGGVGLIAGPDGTRYDLDNLARWVRQDLQRAAEDEAAGGAFRAGRGGPKRMTKAAKPMARKPEMEAIRWYCALNGIEIPYRETGEEGRKEAGIGTALATATAATRGSQLLVVLSDLYGIENNEALLRAVRLARRRHHSVVFLSPDHARFGAGVGLGPISADPEQAELDVALGVLAAREATRQRRSISAALRASRVPVIPCGPSDAVAEVLRRLARGRQAA